MQRWRDKQWLGIAVLAVALGACGTRTTGGEAEDVLAEDGSAQDTSAADVPHLDVLGETLADESAASDRDAPDADEVSPSASGHPGGDPDVFFDADPIACVESITTTDASAVPPVACDAAVWSVQMIAESGWAPPPGGLSAAQPPYTCACLPALDTACLSTCDCKAIYFAGSYFAANRNMPWQVWPYRVAASGAEDECELVQTDGLPTGGQVALAVSATAITCDAGHCILLKFPGAP